MLGMTEGNGHPYSWSIIINGRYNAEALAQCPYAAIIDYISKQPKNTLGIKDVEVSHVWTDLKIFQQWIDEGKPIISSSAMRYCKEYEPYHQSTYELGDLRYINVTMAKSWEKYGIHALETLYPIVGPGFISIQNLGDKDRNIVHLHHSKGIDINIANVFDMIGGFGLVSLVGTKSGIQIKSNDTFYAFKKQLESYVHYLRTGVKPVPWKETKELMQLVAAGIKSREEGGIKINLSEFS